MGEALTSSRPGQGRFGAVGGVMRTSGSPVRAEMLETGCEADSLALFSRLCSSIS